jgi:hypothetical protein
LSEEVVALLLDELSVVVPGLCKVILDLLDIVVNGLHSVSDRASDFHEGLALGVLAVLPVEGLHVLKGLD